MINIVFAPTASSSPAAPPAPTKTLEASSLFLFVSLCRAFRDFLVLSVSLFLPLPIADTTQRMDPRHKEARV